MHLLRVQLPDRPGSLGVIATAMGEVGADISAVEIVENGDGWVIDDFMLSIPAGMMMDTLVSTCNELEGVKVLWVSRYPDSWGLEGDIELLNRMVASPGHAAELLTDSAPVVFHCQWAALLDASSGELLHGSEQAPDFSAIDTIVLGDLGIAHRVDLAAGWLPHWGDALACVVPIPDGRAVVLGRTGGPAFLDSELRRLEHLAQMV